MDSIERNCQGIELRDMKINSIFYADDGIIMANSKAKAEKDLETLKDISEKYGLEINTDKSNIMVFNRKEDFSEIGGIKTTESMKHLGVHMSNKRNSYREHIDKQLMKAKKLENATYSMIESSCNRVIVGKAYWKNICVPAILYGLNSAKVTEKDMEKLQVIENNVYRKILRAPSYAPTGTLCGEIGSATMKARIMKGKILYWKSIQEGGNELMKEIIKNEKCSLNLEVEKYSKIIEMNRREILENNNDSIKEKVRQYDHKVWLIENNKKKTLDMYNANRKEIRERTYYNDAKSLMVYRLRTNTLNLNDRKRHKGESTRCDLCSDIQDQKSCLPWLRGVNCRQR